MPSAIENHSSSLKEAMMVGMPCVSSKVGGVPEYVNHGENGYLYNFEDYTVLAEYISRIFDDDNLALELSKNAHDTIKQMHDSDDVLKNIVDIYGKLV